MMLQLVRVFRGNCGDLLAADMVTIPLVYTQVLAEHYLALQCRLLLYILLLHLHYVTLSQWEVS